jgi:hypothetical protein
MGFAEHLIYESTPRVEELPASFDLEELDGQEIQSQPLDMGVEDLQGTRLPTRRLADSKRSLVYRLTPRSHTWRPREAETPKDMHLEEDGACHTRKLN